jgi:hypothetical protein
MPIGFGERTRRGCGGILFVLGCLIFLTSGCGVSPPAPGSSTYQLQNSSVATETVYLDTTVQSGLSYNYFVTSVDGSGVESGPSNTVSVTIP